MSWFICCCILLANHSQLVRFVITKGEHPLDNTTLYKTLCIISGLTVSVHCLFHRSVLLTYQVPPAWAMAPPYVYVYPQ